MTRALTPILWILPFLLVLPSVAAEESPPPVEKPMAESLRTIQALKASPRVAHQRIAAILEGRAEQLALLEQEARNARSDAAAIDVQMRIAGVKRSTEAAILRVQFDELKILGASRATLERVEAAIEALVAPRPTREPTYRSPAQRDGH